MDLKAIEHITGTADNACSCNSCQQMCKKTPCLGTPQDILTLINNGHRDKLAMTGWAAGVVHDIPVIPMVQPWFDQERGACAFLSDDNLCTLHDAGLKPTEGRLAPCGPPRTISSMSEWLPYQVAKTWLLDQNMSVISKIIRVMR